MFYTNQEMQAAPAGKRKSLSMTLVEPTTSVGTVDNRIVPDKNSQVMWWTLALPAFAIVIIGAAFFLQPLFTSGDEFMNELKDPKVSGPVLLRATSSTKSPSNAEPSNQIFVSSIAYSKTNSIAFVNDQMVSEGDTIDGFTVVQIYQESVVFEKDGKRLTQEISE